MTGPLSGAVMAVGLAFAMPVAAAPGAQGLQPDVAGTPLAVGESLTGMFLAAQFAETVNDFSAAADYTAKLLKARPGDDDIIARGHLLMLGAGRFDEAARLAALIVADHPDHPVANITLAVHDIYTGDFKDAVARLEAFDVSGLNQITVPLLRAWALAGAGRTDAAFDLLVSKADADSLGPVAGLHAGLVAALAGRKKEAAREYKKAVERSGDTVALQLMQAYAGFLFENGQPAQALQMASDYAAKNPQTLLVGPILSDLAEGKAPAPVARNPREGAAAALHAVANLLGREQMAAQSQLLVRMALYLNPEYPPGRYLLGQLMERRQLYDEAIAAYRAIDPASPYGWYAKLNIADVMQAKGDTKAAVRLLRAAIRERPHRADAARALGDLHRFDKRFAEAVAAYDEAEKRAGKSLGWRFYYVRGIALERSKMWQRAENDFLKALTLEPDQPLVLNYLGYSWVEQGVNLERARGMIETAVRKRPKDGYITDSLGWILYRMGDYSGAVTQLERAVALEPADPVINDHLGDAYWLAGRRHEARFQWRRALSQEPEAEAAAQIRAKLGGRDLPKPLPPGKRRDI